MYKHQSVLLNEAVDGLAIKKEGIYIDGTFGRGGHSRAILEQLGDKGRLIAIDKDSEAIAHAKAAFAEDKRFSIYQGSFAELAEVAHEYDVMGKVDGILLDLGLSSPQLDDAGRGFSFMRDGPLDMRMDQSKSPSAAEFVNEASAEEMEQIFRKYGEERFARRIARAIVEARAEKPFERTVQLAEVVKAAHPRWEKHKHPATRVFQAIRIFVNRELEDLEQALAQTMDVLAPGGRLAVISFHSLEDRICKQFMRRQEQGEILPPEIPVPKGQLNQRFKRVSKAIKPKEEEIENNIRARSAVLRIGEKIK